MAERGADGSVRPTYPAHWEADVVLKDGGTARVRPIVPDDAGRLVAFYDRVSDESKYLRFFSPRPRLTDRDVRAFTTVDYDNRVALIALIRDEMVGIVRYDRIGPDGRAVSGDSPVAEVAFLIEDSHHGRGIAAVLLEHLAAAAWECGIRQFTAEVLPVNRPMISLLNEAGYTSHRRSLADGVVHMELSLTTTERSLAVMSAREHRAEARSIQRLVAPRSVAVIGASRDPEGAGARALRNLLGSGFAGPVHAVNHAVDEVGGVRAYRRIGDIPGPVDLAVIAIPAGGVLPVVHECAAKGVHALVVLSTGFGEGGPDGEELQRALVRTARGSGMRVLGPGALGLLNTAPSVSMNATLVPGLPRAGRTGMFAQSGSLGFAVLTAAVRRGIGLSTFVSAGHRVDVSGNDMLQYWEEDPATDVVLMHLETVGNPRKFTRLARRVSGRKPIVAVKTAWHTQGIPVGHAARPLRAPRAVVDALFRQAGVIRVDSADAMFDVAELLARQPLPRGDRVAIVGNSSSLVALTADACVEAGLRPKPPVRLPFAVDAPRVHDAVADALADPATDAVILAFVNPHTVAGERVEAAIGVPPAAGKPLLVAHLVPDEPQDRNGPGDADGRDGDEPQEPHTAGTAPEGEADDGRRPVRTPSERRTRGSVVHYENPRHAVRALAAVTAYARWREEPTGSLVEPDGIDPGTARAVVERAVDERADGGPEPVELSRAELTAVLGAYGIHLWTAVPAPDADAAVAAAAALGYPVVLKTVAERFRHRVDLGGVRLGVADEAALRREHADMCATFGGAPRAELVVQAMAEPGVAVAVGVADEPSFGPVLSFGLAGVPSELLEDRAYRILPATDLDLARLVRQVRAAPILFGYRGTEPVDTAALHDLLARVARLADDLPELAELDLDPVVVASHGLAVLDGHARAGGAPRRPEVGVRSLG